MREDYIIDLYDDATLYSERMNNLLALFEAICAAAIEAGHDTPKGKNKIINIRELAKLGRHLANDFANEYDRDAERLRVK